jgi:hypothetical protein
MKNTTTLQVPASDEGGNHGNGNAASSNQETPNFLPKMPTVQDLLKAVASQQQPHYGQVHFDNGAHYAVGDPVVPTSDGAKVKMDLAGRPTSQRIMYIENHITQTTGNPNFLTPLPSAVDFLAQFTAYRNAALAADAAETLARDAIAMRDQVWAQMLTAMNMRAAYVQAASNGNRQVILSSGLGAQNPRTPTGVLPPPLGLRVDLNGTVGKMILNWDAVSGARTYLVQRAIVVNGVTGPWEIIDAGLKPTLTLNGMTVGTLYAFRVAAMGGSSGMSDWSTVVMRTAA